MAKQQKYPNDNVREVLKEAIAAVLKKNPRKSFSAIELSGYILPSIQAFEGLLKEMQDHELISSKASASIREYKHIKQVPTIDELKIKACLYLSKRKNPVMMKGMLKLFFIEINEINRNNLTKALNCLIQSNKVDQCVSSSGMVRYLLSNKGRLYAETLSKENN
ncbi:MAG: hypothetical protein ACRBFS_10530 [Aureispira sp.]